MEVQFGPNSLDVPNLLYKLQRKIKVFNTSDSLPNRGYNLVTSSSKYAIVFVASPDGILLAYYLNQLIDKECEAQHLTIRLPERPSHIAVSCDQELLAIAGGQLLYVYKITDFQNQNVSPSVSMKCDVNPNTFVSALQWNPCMPDTIAVAFYDGTLLVSQVTTGQINKVQSKARCICWSPKGKQLVTGNADGTLCQYKPNLTPAKTVPAPNLFEGAPVEALAIYWIATYQFAVVYKNAADNSRPAVTIVNIPKAGQPMCYNYEDICYSMGSSRPWYYYLQGLLQWNIILASSSNSMEIATFGSADGVNWQQWCQMDEARPELPLTDKKIENYPIGVCIDTCAIHQLPWGENEVLPHMPLLLVVSQTGLLSIFNVINMNQQAGQLCSPPQIMQLPAAAMTADVPGEPVATLVIPTVQPKPEPVQSPPALVQPTPVSSVPASVFGYMSANLPKPVVQQPQLPPAVSTVAVPQIPEQPTEMKHTLAPVVQAQVQVQAKAPVEPAPKPQSTAQTQEVKAALKAEQERADKIKANKELKDMLIREVNEFQMELYKFMLKTRETQLKLQRDIMECGVPRLENATYNLQAMDTEQLKKDCSLEELRSDIIQLKLELVRACAVVAEARTHAEAKDLHQWTQVDPLTTKRVSTVKKLAYYVQNQVDQAQKALDYKWNEIAARDMKMHKPGQRMIRPILDDVYQPLVRQQEILGRQQAVLRTLRNTLKECEMTPLFKSASLLRSTPFRNKDPLSKLTKNILNMSIEPETKPKEPLLNAQKLDALRDMLSNHKTIKIKPVNVEMRQRLAAMKINYEKCVREKAAEIAKAEQNTEMPKLEPLSPVSSAPSVVAVKIEAKPEIKETPISIPTFTPVSNLKPPTALANVTRTLFTDEPRSEPLKPAIQPPQPISQVQPQPINQMQPQPISQVQLQPISQVQAQPISQAQLQPISHVQPQPMKPQASFTFAAPTISTNTRSVLKDLLKNKQALTDAKNEANLFMGQNICSPTAFSAPASTPPTSPGTTAPINVFTAKPISDINNMFNKFQPQAFVSEPKPQAFVSEPKPQTRYVKPQSSETGEIETPVVAKFEAKEEEKPFSNLFGLKASTPIATSPQIVPDVLNVKIQNKPAKHIEKIAEKLKENVPEKPVESVTQSVHSKVAEDKNDVIKPLGVQTTNKTIFGSSQPVTNAQTVNKSIFGSTQPAASVSPTNAAPAPSEPQKHFEVKTESKTETTKPNTELPDSATTSASLFAAANASTPPISKPQPVIPSTTASTTPVTTQETSTAVETTTKTLFGSTTASTASSIFGAAVAAQPTFAPKTTQSESLFSTSTASTTSSVFEAAPTSMFGAAATTTASSSSTTQSVFTSSESKPSVFSTPTPAAPSVFTATTTTTQSLFGGSAVFPTTTASVFGTSTTASVFGSTTSSIFGGSSTSDASNLFAAAAAATTTTPSSLFGTTVTPSVFGATTTGQSSVFGSSTNTSAQSVFGAATTTAQSSLFGSPTTTQSSVFGGGTSIFGAASTQASVFGSPTATTPAFGSSSPTNQGSIFGSPTQPAASSVFATPATTAQGSSLFGGAEANLFAAASISTTSAPSQSSPGNIFGGSSGSVFGGTTNVFGAKPASTQASSIFGGGTTFGQNTSNNFWSGGNTTGSGFGSAFGQQATTQASTIFGGTTGGSFSAPSTGQPFGSPQQSSAFGSPQQTAASGFGGSPGFGSKAAFGQSAAFSSPSGGGGFGGFGGFNKSPTGGFGAPASFGSGTSFGGSAFGGSSPTKPFGGSSPGFGSPTQSNATFENLATQNTLTFGNLAQQSGQPSQQQPAFNTSPSFTGWRG